MARRGRRRPRAAPVGAPDGEDRLADDGQGAARSRPAAARACVDPGQGDLGEVALGAERVEQEPVGHGRRPARSCGARGRPARAAEGHGGWGRGRRWAAAACASVHSPRKSSGVPCCHAVLDGPDGGDPLGQVGHRPAPGRAVAALDVGPHLGAEAEGEAPGAEGLQVVGEHRRGASASGGRRWRRWCRRTRSVASAARTSGREHVPRPLEGEQPVDARGRQGLGPGRRPGRGGATRSVSRGSTGASCPNGKLCR